MTYLYSQVKGGRGRKPKEQRSWVCKWFLIIPHWPELGHMVSCSCKGIWEGIFNRAHCHHPDTTGVLSLKKRWDWEGYWCCLPLGKNLLPFLPVRHPLQSSDIVTLSPPRSTSYEPKPGAFSLRCWSRCRIFVCWGWEWTLSYNLNQNSLLSLTIYFLHFCPQPSLLYLSLLSLTKYKKTLRK